MAELTGEQSNFLAAVEACGAAGMPAMDAWRFLEDNLRAEQQAVGQEPASVQGTVDQQYLANFLAGLKDQGLIDVRDSQIYYQEGL